MSKKNNFFPNENLMNLNEDFTLYSPKQKNIGHFW